jgi:membrane protein insertase Oxa1/YidC/SpoIIIJ
VTNYDNFIIDYIKYYILMDYKKLIIINLAFLIIFGKLLLFLFTKIQRGLSKVDINHDKVILNIFDFYKNNKNELKFNDDFTIDELLKFKNELDLIKEKYINFDFNLQNENINEDVIKEFENILSHIYSINEFCQKVREQKLKIFILVIVVFFLINYIIIRKIFPFEKIKKIREKMRSILKKLNKTRSDNTANEIKNINSTKLIFKDVNESKLYTNNELTNKKLN